MKKILALALVFLLAVALAACGSPASEPSPAESQLEAMEARLEEMEQQVSSLQAQVPEPEPAPPEEPQTVEEMLAESGMTEGQVVATVGLFDEMGIKNAIWRITNNSYTPEEDLYFFTLWDEDGDFILDAFYISFSGNDIYDAHMVFSDFYIDGEKQDFEPIIA